VEPTPDTVAPDPDLSPEGPAPATVSGQEDQPTVGPDASTDEDPVPAPVVDDPAGEDTPPGTGSPSVEDPAPELVEDPADPVEDPAVELVELDAVEGCDPAQALVEVPGGGCAVLVTIGDAWTEVGVFGLVLIVASLAALVVGQYRRG
jgi:hypothetical protein